MRNLSTEFQSHLSGEVTTLCMVWKLELLDGRVLGFSEHDRDLIIEDVVYSAQSSLTESESENRLGFAADNGSVQGVLNAVNISDAEIADGVLTGACLSRYRVNWVEPSQCALLSVGELGQVTTKGDYFDVEWLGLSTKLDRSTGRVFSKKCDASLGDPRCGVSLDAFAEESFCPKTFSACRDQFNNTANFRGVPYLIGDDSLYAGPIDGERKDGGSRYK